MTHTPQVLEIYRPAGMIMKKKLYPFENFFDIIELKTILKIFMNAY